MVNAKFMNGDAQTAGSSDGTFGADSAEGADFIARFCEKFKCNERQYEKRFLCECVYPEGRGMARLLWLFAPGHFKAEQELMEQLRHAPNLDEVKRLIHFFEVRYAPEGFFAVVLKVRFSARRLLQTAESVFTPAE